VICFTVGWPFYKIETKKNWTPVRSTGTSLLRGTPRSNVWKHRITSKLSSKILQVKDYLIFYKLRVYLFTFLFIKKVIGVCSYVWRAKMVDCFYILPYCWCWRKLTHAQRFDRGVPPQASPPMFFLSGILIISLGFLCWKTINKWKTPPVTQATQQSFIETKLKTHGEACGGG